MANCLPKELNKQEQIIVNDIMQRSNLNLEDATTIARTMIEWGYTIHEQDYNRLKIALDILKNKIVNIPKLLTTTLIVYNNLALLLGYDKLTQEEYELLKNVMEE